MPTNLQTTNIRKYEIRISLFSPIQLMDITPEVESLEIDLFERFGEIRIDNPYPQGPNGLFESLVITAFINWDLSVDEYFSDRLPKWREQFNGTAVADATDMIRFC